MTTWQILWVIIASSFGVCTVAYWLTVDAPALRAASAVCLIMTTVWLVAVGALAVWEV